MAPKLIVHTQQMFKVSSLNPQPYNPRKITPGKYEALKQNILAEGFLEPLVVQKKTNAIIGGHQRYRVWKELSIEANVAPPDLPCIVLDIDDTRAKKLNIKLNSLTGEFEPRMLGELLIDIYEQHLPVEEVELLGFESAALSQYIRLVDPDYPGLQLDTTEEPKSFARSITLSIEFETIAVRDRVKKLLMEQAKLEKKKTGEVVNHLLAPKRKSKLKTAARKSRAA